MNVISASIALIALLVAWQAVKQQQQAAEDVRRQNALRAFDDVIEVVSQLRLSVMNSRGAEARAIQARLRATLPLVPWDLPKCSQLANAPVTKTDEFIEAQVLAEAAMEELATASEPFNLWGSLNTPRDG